MLAPGAAAPNDSAVTTPPDQPDPWAPDPNRTSRWEQPPGTPPPPPPGWGPPPGQPGSGPPPGWSPAPGQPGMPPPGWPQQGPAGDWSAPGYGYWGAPKNNGMGTAALVLGIIALPAVFTVLGGFVFGVLALIFGLIGRGRVKRREADNGGVATAGVVLGSIAIVASIAFVVFVFYLAGDAIQDCIDEGNSRAYCEENFTVEID